MAGVVRIPSFQQSIAVVDDKGRFTPAALRSLNDAFRVLGTAINAIAALPEIQDALLGLDAATQAAQSAADAANEAAAVATDTAATAQTAADAANGAVDQIADGTFSLDAVKIGGVRFTNQGGELLPEP